MSDTQRRGASVPPRGRMLALAALLMVGLAAPALAHPGEVAAPHDLWSRWSFEPGIITGIVLSAAWYAHGARRLRRAVTRSARRQRRRTACFWGGVATLLLALVSPLDAAAEAIFAAHMLQHLLLILVAAPLFVLAAPAPALWWGLPDDTRRAAARSWRRAEWLRATWSIATAPGPVLAMHVAALWFWHFPGPYQAALRDPFIHSVEHLSFFGTACLFWWVVLQPAGHRRLSYPAAILYVVATMGQGGALGLFLMNARTPWYPAHAEGARLWGLTLLHDQQLAGLVMWIPAGMAYVVAGVWLFWRWMQVEELAASRHAARQLAAQTVSNSAA